MEPFYGKEIDPGLEREKIEKLLSKYRQSPVSEDLKKKIYQELSAAKERGEISIPFKVVLRTDPSGKHRPVIEIALETKV